ncbi:hypothetical protein [Rhodococcus sp. 114MFTsu3.1]|uniref:hypothetical protein n=1 Tax=Rhodococcus sp. 114MFTsu3.1 TaxID=1172184 RepID=UPI0009DB9F81|nr:hypothetical protein [Rhodococcus sp. 114MFTsu3.1]
MKVSASVRAEFEKQLEINSIIRDRVDKLLRPAVQERWHYESRLKQETSFALKLETGRFSTRDMNDVFACTIVVPTLQEIPDAENLVLSRFSQVDRKPASDAVANIAPTSFTFDHIRLYVQLLPPPGLPPQPINSITFEVQVKTFLQHAWSIATHDLTYKTSKVSWGKERIASQVKAALESAELAIAEAEYLGARSNPIVNKESKQTSELLHIVESLQREFDQPYLPDNIKSLASSILRLFFLSEVAVIEIDDIASAGKAARGGLHPSDYSPYGVFLQYFFEQKSDQLKLGLKRRRKERIFVPPEITVPDNLMNSCPSSFTTI